MVGHKEIQGNFQVAQQMESNPTAQLVDRLKCTMKALKECQSDSDVQELSLRVQTMMSELSGVSNERETILKAMKEAELALKQDGQKVKAKRMGKMHKLMCKLPKESPKKQRKMLREILTLSGQNVGVSMGKRGLCGCSFLCTSVCISGSVLALAGASALIAMAAMGHLEDIPEDSGEQHGNSLQEATQEDGYLDPEISEGLSKDEKVKIRKIIKIINGDTEFEQSDIEITNRVVKQVQKIVENDNKEYKNEPVWQEFMEETNRGKKTFLKGKLEDKFASKLGINDADMGEIAEKRGKRMAKLEFLSDLQSEPGYDHSQWDTIKADWLPIFMDSKNGEIDTFNIGQLKKLKGILDELKTDGNEWHYSGDLNSLFDNWLEQINWEYLSYNKDCTISDSYNWEEFVRYNSVLENLIGKAEQALVARKMDDYWLKFVWDDQSKQSSFEQSSLTAKRHWYTTTLWSEDSSGSLSIDKQKKLFTELKWAENKDLGSLSPDEIKELKTRRLEVVGNGGLDEKTIKELGIDEIKHMHYDAGDLSGEIAWMKIYKEPQYNQGFLFKNPWDAIHNEAMDRARRAGFQFKEGFKLTMEIDALEQLDGWQNAQEKLRSKFGVTVDDTNHLMAEPDKVSKVRQILHGAGVGSDSYQTIYGGEAERFLVTKYFESIKAD